MAKNEIPDEQVLSSVLLNKLRFIAENAPDRLRQEYRAVLMSHLAVQEVSAQEAAWCLLQHDIVRCTRKVERVVGIPPEDRNKVLRPREELAQLADDDTNVFVNEHNGPPGQLAHAYMMRPSTTFYPPLATPLSDCRIKDRELWNAHTP